MTKKEYTVGTYVKKKPRKNKTGKICLVCSGCKDKKYCNQRRNITKMRKCPECSACSDAEHCDVFYINIEHKITIPVGKDDNGKTIRKSFTGKTDAEAMYKSVQYQKDVEDGKITPSVNKKVLSIVTITEEYQQMKLKNGLINENTYITNMCTLDRVRNEKFANIPIKEVTRKHIEDFLLMERDNELSNSVLKKDFGLLRTAFDIAMDREYITSRQNFFLGKYGVIRPTSKKKDKKVGALTIEEQKQLVSYLNATNLKHKNLILLALNLGCRIGELLSISTSDICLEKNYFYIHRTTTLDLNRKVKLGEKTKTSAGERMIVLNNITRPILECAISNMIENPNNLIFCKDNGMPYGDSGINSAFKRMCKNAGIARSVNTHMLRHTFIKRSKEAGVDVEATRLNAGHESIEITMGVYNENQIEYLESQGKNYENYISDLMK